MDKLLFAKRSWVMLAILGAQAGCLPEEDKDACMSDTDCNSGRHCSNQRCALAASAQSDASPGDGAERGPDGRAADVATSDTASASCKTVDAAKMDGPCPAGMVYVEGGTFQPAKFDPPTAGGVKVDAFCMDLTEVTASDYAACVSGGCCKAANTGLTCNYGAADRRSHPINCVTWNQAVAYCAWAQKSLPGEEQWEWAARGGARGNVYPWGNTAPTSNDDPPYMCWSARVPRSSTCPVQGFPRGNSPLGIADLAGNVDEWTTSVWPGQPPGRVLRGGSWSFQTPIAEYYTAGSRSGTDESNGADMFGFRCVSAPRQ